MVGFGGPEGWFLKEEVTAKQAQRDAKSLDLAVYLLLPIEHNTRHQARKKKPEGTREPGTEPYMKTTCRRLVFRVLLDHTWKHVPDAEELEAR